MTVEQATSKRNWRPSFSLLTLVLGMLFVGACGGLWYRWEPWVRTCVILASDGGAMQAVYSPDGRLLLALGNRGTVCVLDAITGQVRATLKGHSTPVFSAAFSSDGRRVVTAGDHTARVWDLETGQECVNLRGHTDFVRSAGFSPDGRRIVTASDDQTARVWDAETGQERLVIGGHTWYVSCACYSPDGRWILTASSDYTACVSDAQTGQRRTLLEGHNGSVKAASFSPDGRRIVTASQDHTARVWDAETGQVFVTLKEQDALESACYSSDGSRIITSGNDARLWDAETGQECTVLKGLTGSVRSAKLAADGQRIVTAVGDRDPQIWDARTGEELATLKEELKNDEVWYATFSPDGQHIAVATVVHQSVWSRRRPEYWWGIAWLPEFWVALLSGGALLVLAACRLRARKASERMPGGT